MEKKFWHDATTELPERYGSIVFTVINEFGNEVVCRDDCLFIFMYGYVHIINDGDIAYSYNNNNPQKITEKLSYPEFFALRRNFDECGKEYYIFKNVIRWAYESDLDDILLNM